MSGLTKNCYVDCTETLCTDLNTGIQRTVRNIISRHASMSSACGINVVPVVSVNGAFYRYDLEHDKRVYVRLLDRLFRRARGAADLMLLRKKGAAALAPLESGTHAARPVAGDGAGAKAPGSIREAGDFASRFLERCRKIMPWFFLAAFYLDHALIDLKTVAINQDDILFYPDAFWHTRTFSSMPRYDAVKILLVYDIIPITNPEVCDAGFSRTFSETLPKVLRDIDGVITISQSELGKITSYCDGQSKKNLQCDFFHIGADFAATGRKPGRVKDCIAAALSGGQTFIVVGSIEPRKNLAFVIDAFEEFWLKGATAPLCIIGRPGWNSAALLDRIASHPYLGTRLFYFRDTDDHELVFCYENCAAVVFASLAEGFGLPLVEAMWYGRPVLASDIEVFRETGGDYPLYFSLDGVASLVSQLHVCLGAGWTLQPKKWITWDGAVLDLFGKILAMARAVKADRSRALKALPEPVLSAAPFEGGSA